jgi:hypothetical protein
MRGKSVLGVLVSAIAAVSLAATPSSAKEITAIETGTVGKAVQVGPYIITVKRLTLNGSGDLRSLDAVQFSIANRSARRVRMPFAVAGCQGGDTWAGTSLLPGSARRAWLGAKQRLEGVRYLFESNSQGCPVPEVRLGLEVPPDSGRFTQLRIAVHGVPSSSGAFAVSTLSQGEVATDANGCPVPSPLPLSPHDEPVVRAATIERLHAEGHEGAEMALLH